MFGPFGWTKGGPRSVSLQNLILSLSLGEPGPYIYIYIYRERERERERGQLAEMKISDLIIGIELWWVRPHVEVLRR